MAAIANHSLSLPSRRPLSSSRPLKTLNSTVLSVRRNPSCECVPLSRTLLSSPIPRRSFKAFVNVADSSSKTVNGDGENQISENVNQKDLPRMKILIQAYKKAIIEGDEKNAHEIEALICILDSEKESLSKTLTEIITEIASSRDKFLRLKADFENFRKQSVKDRLNFTSDIQGDVIESLLPMVDSFEKTKMEIKPETDKGKKIETSYQGIYKQFVEVMRSLGVAVVETVGKPFDPSIHEAIAREESEQFKVGIVSQELRRGFLLGNRLLRTATVKVSAGPIQAKATDEERLSNEAVEVKSPEDSTPTTTNS
ncbi:hypothetical protein Cni_G09585 [Canna indica]|uniref:GrpE protein homolog n=1 Tax=Canna indica TaxID=4628 RepID=A0AAQ3K5X3_9LILI|nr:hypothetical protein Cni_G09585 [Canna indica]